VIRPGGGTTAATSPAAGHTPSRSHGGNYGWPTFGYGRDNDGSPMLPPGEGIEPAWTEEDDGGVIRIEPAP